MSSFDEKSKNLRIPFETVRFATNDFADQNLIGQGGFGKIYRGQLLIFEKLIDIAARRLDHKDWRGINAFRTEILMLSSLKKHRNLVSIVGFCDDNGEMIIINKYEAKGSLDQYLNDPITLTWTQRLQICVGIARALSYIHYDEGRSFSVIHRNVKSSKILLDENWEAKLSGFELSKMQQAALRHRLVFDQPAAGTFGYIDPVYIRTGGVNHKSDLYSLGVVLLEVLCGRKAYISPYLVGLAKTHYDEGKVDNIIHPGLREQMDPQSLKIFLEVAYWSLKEKRGQRPNIDQIVFALEKALEHQFTHEQFEHSVAAVEGSSSINQLGVIIDIAKTNFTTDTK